MMISLSAFIVVLLPVLPGILAHSTMTDPQAISPGTCRLGGEPQFGVLNCPGPCDLAAIENTYSYSNHGSPSNPARIFKRGEQTTIKYQRNNHGPGGFIRLTLVTPDQIMDKSAHKRNAFHYSCWGAKPVQAPPNELEKDKFGFTFVGSDGEQHNSPKGYYIADVTIPTCVPDGDYVMGWVWYGGTGGSIQSNAPHEPVPWGYFGDYWSCSFVRIEGGVPLAPSYEPVFVNDMGQFSAEGCMSANDEPGICASEPCKVDGSYQKPKSFKNGNKPEPLTPGSFGVFLDKSFESETPVLTSISPDSNDPETSPVDISPSPVSAQEMNSILITTPPPVMEIMDTMEENPEHSMGPDHGNFDIMPPLAPEETLPDNSSEETIEESEDELPEQRSEESRLDPDFIPTWYNNKFIKNIRKNWRY